MADGDLQSQLTEAKQAVKRQKAVIRRERDNLMKLIARVIELEDAIAQTDGDQCEDCGQPATRVSDDGVPLCAGCYDHLCEQALTVPEDWSDDYF